EPSRYRRTSDPSPAPWGARVGAPVGGLVHVDEGDDRVDGVPEGGEARVVAGTLGRRWRGPVKAAYRLHQVMLCDVSERPEGHKHHGQGQAGPPRLVPVFDGLVQQPVAGPAVPLEVPVFA